MSDPYVAWVVLLVEPRPDKPPRLAGAVIAPTPQPTPPPSVETARPVAILCAEGATYAEAESEARALLSAPAWRWLYALPVLGPGFRHSWRDGAEGDPRRCERCGLDEDAPAVRSHKLGPQVCLVSHFARCATCGEDHLILAGSASCIGCAVHG